MTHRIPSRRWQENPERRVGQAQLNRAKQAATPGKTQPASRQEAPPRDPRAKNHTH